MDARAKAIVEELLKGQKTTDLGETMAMTLAELGDYAEAAAVQRDSSPPPARLACTMPCSA